MGREVRKVPPHWDHPDQERGSGLQPMFDERFEDAAREWNEIGGMTREEAEDQARFDAQCR